MKLVPALFLLLPLCIGRLSAQDLHFTQFYLHPLHQNPAQTGSFQGDWRVSGIYRSQWRSVPVSYQTFGAAADIKMLRSDKNMLALGVQLQHDQAGDAALRWAQFGLTASATHALGERQAISAGFGVSAVQRSFDISGLRFKNQWDGDLFNPDLSSKENFNQNSGFAPSMSAGVNWRLDLDDDSRNTVYAGLGAFHLNGPAVNFRDDATFKLPLRMALSLGASLPAGESFDVVAFALGQQMSTAREILIGLGARYWLDEAYVQFSTGYRSADALTPALQIGLGSWTVGLSYDINISNFDVATQNRGGFELGVVYQSQPVPPVKTLKVCPIF
jgi:type IX secretion system PorP/SprF family membrane protein